MSNESNAFSNHSPVDTYRISVIVPTYNRAKYIEECLDSLLAQTVSAHEIIVVDDGSEDDTAQRVLRYGGIVRYVHKANGGKSSAVNLALKLVEGDWVWLFDDDDVALPDAIESRIEILGMNPDTGLVYSPHFLGSDGPHGRIVRGRLHETPRYTDERFFYELMKGCFFHLATALVRTDVYRAVGGFDSVLLRSQDYDAQIRIARVAHAVFSRVPTFIFRQHAGLRGPKLIRSPGEKRSAVFQTYDQLVGRKIRESFPLSDYLIPRGVLGPGTEDQRRALLSRMVVMASKGCVNEMFDDLRSALETLEVADRLTTTEMEMIRNAMSTGYAYRACRDKWEAFLGRLEETIEYPQGRKVILCMAASVARMTVAYPGSMRIRLSRLSAGLSMSLIVFRDIAGAGAGKSKK